MHRIVRETVRELAREYRDAAPEDKAAVARNAADAMAMAGLDQAESVELWYEVVWELAARRRLPTSPWGESSCERCGERAVGTICSTFNTEQICLVCKSKETRHPEYARARAKEEEAVRAGNYNFPGVGKPSDL